MLAESKVTGHFNCMRRGQETREAAVRAGLRLVHRSGFTATGVAEVTSAAGMPKGSFFNHFKSKQGFAKEVISRYGASVIDGVSERLLQSSVTAHDGLHGYFSWLRDLNEADGFQSGCLMGNLAGEVAALDDEVRDELARQFTGWSGAIAFFLSRWTDTRRADEIAGALLDSWHGAVLRAKAERSPAALERFIQITLPALLKEGGFET